MHAIGPLVGHVIIVTTSGGRVRKLMLKDLHDIVKNHIFARAIHHVWHKTGLRPCQHLWHQRLLEDISLHKSAVHRSDRKLAQGLLWGLTPATLNGD